MSTSTVEHVYRDIVAGCHDCYPTVVTRQCDWCAAPATAAAVEITPTGSPWHDHACPAHLLHWFGVARRVTA